MTTPSNSDAERIFFDAVKAGKLAEVRMLAIANPALLDAYDYEEFGGPPLNLAAGHRRNLAMTKLLIELGADLNRASDWHPGPWPPAQIALASLDNDKIVDVLTSAGAEIDAHVAAGTDNLDRLTSLLDADPKLVHARGGDGCLPLHLAKTPRIVDCLIDRGADLEARDVDHYSTALQWLATRRPAAARHLIARGAQLDPFSVVACGDVETLTRLLKDQPDYLSWRMNEDYYPKGPGDAMNILTFTVGHHATLLHAAVTGNRPELIPLLVDAGIDPNSRGGYDDCSPLHLAAWENYPECAAALIAAGADIDLNSGKIHANSPMGWAIVAGSVDAAKLLLQHGCQRRDYFPRDAQLGVDGEFRQIKTVPAINHQQILAMLGDDPVGSSDSR